MTQEKTTIYQLEKNLIDELNDNKKEILESEYPSDLITEYADSWIPVYNSDLIEALSDDHTLAYVDEQGLLPEDPSVHDIIRVAIYERLIAAAYEWLNENENKKEVAQSIDIITKMTKIIIKQQRGKYENNYILYKILD